MTPPEQAGEPETQGEMGFEIAEELDAVEFCAALLPTGAGACTARS